jgi:glycosyltransferase involved in cell wall biosynthesis
MGIKIHVYTICWNEALMLPHFLRHYSNFCDKIVVYDNDSTDASMALCKALPKVQTKSYFTGNQIRDDIYLKIKNEAWKQSRGHADYVIVCDVDELIYHPQLVSFLESAHRQGISLFRCKGYNMITEHTPLPKDSIVDTIGEGARAQNFDKVCVFDPNRIEEINYEFGAHSCLPIGELQFNQQDLLLLHYKYMGVENMIARYREMGKRLGTYNKKRKLGYHYLFSESRIRKEFKDVWKKREKVF